jgi:hypothetical protein
VKLAECITSVACGVWVVFTPLAMGQAVPTSAQMLPDATQALLDQATSVGSERAIFVAWKELHGKVRHGTREEADAIHAALMARLGDAKDRDAVRRIVMLLAIRPTVASVTAIIQRFDGGGDYRVQTVLCESLTKGLAWLSPEDRKSLAGFVVPRMLAIIQDPYQSCALASCATRCLGALEDNGYAVMRQLAEQPALRKAMADGLPSALAATKDARALDLLVSLCDTDATDSKGRRIASINAIGDLMYVLRKAGTPVPDQSYQEALTRIRQYLRLDGDPQLLAVAIRAGARAVGVDRDETLRQIVIAALGHADADVRAAAMEALVASQTAKSPDVKEAVLRLKAAETQPVARAAAEAVIGAAEAQE